MLESLGLLKPDAPAKPKRTWVKKVYERNPDRVLRPQVVRCAADWTPIHEPAKSKLRTTFVARSEETTPRTDPVRPVAMRSRIDSARSEATITRIDPAAMAEPFFPPCPRCAGAASRLPCCTT